MSVGTVGTSSANLALWTKVLESTHGNGAQAPGSTTGSAGTPAPPAYHGVSGASPSGHLISVKA